ncbi:MAG: divalent cation tolerance protein CutA, partial [Prosthecobacter sp.]|nr:divalent cation tolerance protein CutA [Prosthecobacter sp.]
KASEVLAIFKTTVAAYPLFELRLKELHPYDVPEIVAVAPQEVSADYAAWVRAEVYLGLTKV